LPKSDYLPSFDNGQASITSEFVLKGDEIDGRMDFSMDGLSSPKEDGKNDELRSVINGLWSGITKISVNARMYGKSDALQWSFSSNIDSVLGDRMKNLYGQKYAEVQNRVKAEIARLTEEKQKEVLAEFSSRKNALLKEYSAKEKELQDKIDSVRAQITTKENEIKGQGEREKKKAEDEIKKQAEDKLKSLFKR
jgi:hypothetical protein